MFTINRLVAVVSLAVACAPVVHTTDDGPGDAWCSRHFCDPEATTYTAIGAGMYAVLAPIMERYRVATGRYDLRTDPQAGIPVRWQERLLHQDPDETGGYALNGDGSLVEDCAQTETQGIHGHWMRTQAILVDPTPAPGCPDPSVSLSHELIHALAPMAQHVLVDSLFARSTGPAWRPVDATALERLCETFVCADFVPED